MEWKLDDDRPIWLQLSQQLARRIVTGTYPPGSRLPSVRELAAEAGVNPFHFITRRICFYLMEGF